MRWAWKRATSDAPAVRNRWLVVDDILTPLGPEVWEWRSGSGFRAVVSDTEITDHASLDEALATVEERMAARGMSRR